jgi:hypothetical protein
MPVVTMSKRFQFGEVSAYTLPTDDESGWTAVPLDASAVRLTNKWVYVFQVAATGATPARGVAASLVRACFIEGPDTIHVFNGAAAKVAASVELNPLDVPAVQAISLPDLQDATQFFYYFFASRIQLDSTTISELETKVSNFIDPINLPDLDFVANFVAAPGTFDLVSVVDPITIAEKLQSDYEASVDQVFERLSDADELPPNARDEARKRGALRLLGSYLQTILKADAADVLKIGGKSDVLATIDKSLADDKAATQGFIDRQENKASALVRWLSSSIWSLVERSFRENEIADYNIYLETLATVTARLVESSIGKTYFANFDTKNSYVFTEYVARESILPADKFPLVKKCAGALTSILKDLVPFLAKASADDGGKTVAKFLNNLARTQLAIVEDFGIANIPMRTTTGSVELTARLSGLAKNPNVAIVDFDTWVRRGKQPANVLSLLFDLTNLLLNTRKFLDKFPKADRESFFAGLKLASTTASVAKGFAAILETSSTDPSLIKRLGRVKGGLGAVAGGIETFFAMKDGFDARNRHDWGAVVGDSFVVTGSALSFVAGINALDAAGLIFASSRSGLVGFLASLFAVSGALIVAFFADTDFNTFVKNCSFGANHLQSDTKPSWSTTNVNTWTDDGPGLARQLDALYSLTCAFQVTGIGALQARILLGDVTSSTKVFVEYVAKFFSNDAQNSLAELNPRFRIDPINGVVDDVVQDPAAIKVLSSTMQNRIALDVSANWPNGIGPASSNQSTIPLKPAKVIVQVWVDVFGDGSKMIPTGGPLCCTIFDDPVVETTTYNSAIP